MFLLVLEFIFTGALPTLVLLGAAVWILLHSQWLAGFFFARVDDLRARGYPGLEPSWGGYRRLIGFLLGFTVALFPALCSLFFLHLLHLMLS